MDDKEESNLKAIMEKYMNFNKVDSSRKKTDIQEERINRLQDSHHKWKHPSSTSSSSSKTTSTQLEGSLLSDPRNILSHRNGVTPSSDMKMPKTPSPPKESLDLQILQRKLATTGRINDKTRRETEASSILSNGPPPSVPSVKTLASFDSAVKRIEGTGGNRLFQTPSQSLNLTSSQDLSRMTNLDVSSKLKKLQSSGLLDKIKAMQTAMLTSSLGQLNEDDDEEDEEGDVNTPGEGLRTAIQSQVPSSSTEPSSDPNTVSSEGSTDKKSSQETEIIDREDSEDEEDNKENTGGQDTVKEVNQDDSVLFLEKKASKVFSIRKKFTLNTPSSQLTSCQSRRKQTKSETSSSLQQTTLDKYFGTTKSSKTTTSPESVNENPCLPPPQTDSQAKQEDASPSLPADPSLQPDLKTLPSASDSCINKRDTSDKEVVASQAEKPVSSISKIRNQAKDRHEDVVDGIPERVKETKERQTESVVTRIPSPAQSPSAKNVRRRSKSEANIPSLLKSTAKTKSRSSSKESLKSAPDDNRNNKGSHHQDLKKLRINGRTYFLLSLLGQGGSARVYQVYDASTHKNYAVKVVDLTKADATIRAGYENEILLLQKLSKCKRVVRLIDFERVCGSDGVVKRLFLVMEKGDTDLANVLKQFIEKDASAPHGLSLDRHLIKHYWKEMIKAVDEIHDLDVVHSDLKPVNFITVAGKLKLIDFGIANAIDSGHTSVIKDNQIGTINYMAPEALQSRADLDSSSFSGRNLACSSKPIIKFNCKADIWSLGCILYNLVYGRPPFSHISSLLQKVQVICNPKYAIDFPPLDDQHLIDCLKVKTGVECME